MRSASNQNARAAQASQREAADLGAAGSVSFTCGLLSETSIPVLIFVIAGAAMNVLLTPGCSNQILTPAPSVGNGQLLRPLASSKRWRKHCRSTFHVCQSKAVEAESLVVDPEAKFKRYGAHFGAKYSLDFNELMGNVPRVRMRQSSDRQKSLLAELALVNERLAGKQSWEIRQKLEHLKSKRKNWELIYQYVTKLDATATLARIEEANTKVQPLKAPLQTVSCCTLQLMSSKRLLPKCVA